MVVWLFGGEWLHCGSKGDDYGSFEETEGLGHCGSRLLWPDVGVFRTGQSQVAHGDCHGAFDDRVRVSGYSIRSANQGVMEKCCF